MRYIYIYFTDQNSRLSIRMYHHYAPYVSIFGSRHSVMSINVCTHIRTIYVIYFRIRMSALSIQYVYIYMYGGFSDQYSVCLSVCMYSVMGVSIYDIIFYGSDQCAVYLNVCLYRYIPIYLYVVYFRIRTVSMSNPVCIRISYEDIYILICI